MCVDDWHMCKWARQGCFLRPKEPHGADMGRYMGDAKQPATGAPKRTEIFWKKISVHESIKNL